MNSLALRFAEALGNKFLLSDCRTASTQDWRQYTKVIDQVIEIHPSLHADKQLVFYNCDGSEAEACGNGTRCAALWLFEQTQQKDWRFETLGGIISVSVENQDNITVTLPSPKLSHLLTQEISIPTLVTPHIVDIGNPHLVLWIKKSVDVKKWGPKIEKLFPDGINVSFSILTDQSLILLNVWERGAGATAACGTAACATHASAFLNGFVGTQSLIKQPGGILQVAWAGPGEPLSLTGPACLGDYT